MKPLRLVMLLGLAACACGKPASRPDHQLKAPQALTALPGGRALVAEPSGRLRVAEADGTLSYPVAGMPGMPVTAITLDPGFVDNQRVYLTLADEAVVHARLVTGTAPVLLSDDDDDLGPQVGLR